MTEPTAEKPLSAMVDEAFAGIKVAHRDTRPALTRQMVWDAFADQDVERVITELGMTPASPEVYGKELRDSHKRLTDLDPMKPMVGMLIDIMAQTQTAAMTSGADMEEVPDIVKHQVLHFNHRLIYSTIMSTLATLNTLGHINVKVADGR